MRPRKIFKYYLCDTVLGTFFKDVNGSISTTSIPVALRRSPGGWEDTVLKVTRSTHYHGLNTEFSAPLKFVDDGAAILRELYYTKRGIEQPVTLVILKWDDTDDNYYLYFKGIIDFSTWLDTVSEGVSVNILQGGVVQFLKNMDSKVVEIPCDGSIPENIKVGLDGLSLQDTFFYQIPKFTAIPNGGYQIMPCVFLSNNGDNIGVIKGNPTLQGNFDTGHTPNNLFFQQSSNLLFSSVEPITVRISGYISITSIQNPGQFALFLITSLSSGVIIGDALDHSVNLVPSAPAGVKVIAIPTVGVTYYFDATISLDANENLFLTFFGNAFGSDSPTKGFQFSGNFSLSFISLYPQSNCWGIRAYDLFKLIVKACNELSSTTNQIFNFAADSKLLQENLNFVVTSGDAIRASADPDYLKFFNPIQSNPVNTNFEFFNFYYSFGPVIKTSIADFFDAFNPILSAALSNEQLVGKPESVFLEAMDYVYDSSVITMEVGEINELKVTTPIDLFWNTLKVGSPVQQYDEKAGKYETNTTAQFSAPIKTVQRELDLLTKYRIDPYGIEYTRSNNTRDSKSSTYNDSDNSVFILNTDQTSGVYDTDTAQFNAIPQGPGIALDGSQKFVGGVGEQGIFLPKTAQTYLRPTDAPAIFVINRSGAPGTAVYTYTGTVSGFPGDTLTLNFYLNSIIVQTKTYTATGAATPFSDTVTVTGAFNSGDCLFVKAVCSPTGFGSVDTMSMIIGAGWFNVNSVAQQSISMGNIGELVVLASTPTGTVFPISSVNTSTILPSGAQNLGVSYGFQYFVFNQVLNNNNFNILLHVFGFESGNPGDYMQIKLYINGTPAWTNLINGNGAENPYDVSSGFFNGNLKFGDIFFATMTATTTMQTQINNATLQLNSTQILVYPLLRKQYDQISGIPCLLGNISTFATPNTNIPITTGPGAPFNIEGLTPKRMLLKNGPLLKSTLFNLSPDPLKFLTLDKNQFLSTTLNGVTIKENAPVDLSDLGDPLMYPVSVEFKTSVPRNFYDLVNDAVNGHIHGTYCGFDVYVFPTEIMQKPALNESQVWKGYLSTRTNLAQFKDMNFDGLNITLASIMANQIFFSKISPLQWVPYNGTMDPRYNFIHIDNDWFINQANFYVNKKNYFQKWQSNDIIPLQCITNGITSVTANIYQATPTVKNSASAKLVATVTLIEDPESPLNPPYILLRGSIDITGLALSAGNTYYVTGADASGNVYVISEGFTVSAPVTFIPGTQMPRLLLLEYSNSYNKQSTIFSNGFVGCLRVEGYIDQFTPEGSFTTYTDEPADIELLNAVPYETFKLNIAISDGIPDWVIRKIDRIMDLDTVLIDGKQFTKDGDSKWEVTTVQGWAKRYWSIKIRPAVNRDGVTYNPAGGVVDSDIIVTSMIDLAAFGNNNGIAGPNLLSVEETD